VACMVSCGTYWRLLRCGDSCLHDRPKAAGDWDGKYDLVNCWQRADGADSGGSGCHRCIHGGDGMISEIEIIHMLDNDEAEFPQAALLSALLIQRGWVAKMPAKYQAMVASFTEAGIIRMEETKITKEMKPRIRFILQEGEPTIAESIGGPIEVTIIDKARDGSVTTAVYSTHEGETFPVPLFMFDAEKASDDWEVKLNDDDEEDDVKTSPI